MLGRRDYSLEYVRKCRARIDAAVRDHDTLVEAGGKTAGGAESAPGSTVDGVHHRFFNDMVLVLDYCFVHRLRGVEGKDGNPLNEVRVLCDSMLLNEGRVAVPDSIKLDPATSVLKHGDGDAIRLSRSDFVALSEAFFDEVEARFLEA